MEKFFIFRLLRGCGNQKKENYTFFIIKKYTYFTTLRIYVWQARQTFSKQINLRMKHICPAFAIFLDKSLSKGNCFEVFFARKTARLLSLRKYKALLKIFLNCWSRVFEAENSLANLHCHFFLLTQGFLRSGIFPGDVYANFKAITKFSTLFFVNIYCPQISL